MTPPVVSVVLPTRNRKGPLQEALAALGRQQAPFAIETIVVDDGSSDGTAGVLEAGEQAGRWRVVPSGGRGAAAARNAGVREARGEIVAFTDDDCLVPRDWAASLASRLAAPGVAGVGGRVVAPPDAPLPVRVSQAITNGLVEGLNLDPGQAVFLTSNNAAYRRSDLRGVGGFDESFGGAGGEERELNRRLRSAGRRLVYAREIVVVHRAAFGWGGFLRQQASYGRGARRYYSLGGDGSHRSRGLTLAQYVRAFGRALRELPGRDRLALLVGAALSQGAVAWGYTRGASGGKGP